MHSDTSSSYRWLTAGLGFAFCTLLLFQQRPFCLRWGQHFVFSCRPMCLCRTGCQYHCNAHDCLERLTAKTTYCVVTGDKDVSHDIIAIRDADVTFIARNLLIIMVALWNTEDPYIFILFLSSSFFFFLLFLFPHLISEVRDWMSTILSHMVWP